MNYQQQHIEKLQSILEAIEWKNKRLVVDTYYRNGSNTDPYLYLTDGDVELVEGGNLMDSYGYEYRMLYGLTVVFNYDDNLDDPTRAVDMRELKALIIQQLITRKVRDDDNQLYNATILQNYPKWSDLKLTGMTGTDQINPEVEDVSLYQTYTIQITQIVEYDRS